MPNKRSKSKAVHPKLRVQTPHQLSDEASVFLANMPDGLATRTIIMRVWLALPTHFTVTTYENAAQANVTPKTSRRWLRWLAAKGMVENEVVLRRGLQIDTWRVNAAGCRMFEGINAVIPVEQAVYGD